MTELLLKRGYSVRTAESGDEAMRAWPRTSPT
jgi:CheY-like chemotaxis protein